MKRTLPKVTMVLDTRRQLKNSTYPVKLRVTVKKTQRYFSTGAGLTPEDWNKMNNNPSGALQKLKHYLNELERQSVDTIEKMAVFSFFEFRRLWENKDLRSTNIFDAFERKIAELSNDKKFSTAETYLNASKKLKEFHKGETLEFQDITPRLLKNFESFMVRQKRSVTTISIYTRNIRTLYNEAIRVGLVTKDLYPFGRHRYQPPEGRNVKKALNLDQIKLIFDYEPDNTTPERFCKDLWIFSYLCAGMNIQDVLSLKWEDLEKDKITYHRAKTAPKRSVKAMAVIISLPAMQVIDFWGTNRQPGNYIFPVLSPKMPEKIKREKTKNLVKLMNKYMNIIGRKLGIDQKITTYTARHSFATVLKRSGAPISFISDALGHSSMKTTQNYLDSFEDDVKKGYFDKLIDF